MFFSNFVMYFIILTTAATLHAHGKTSIETAHQAAEALRPLAGNGAYLLFTLGLIGTGILAILLVWQLMSQLLDLELLLPPPLTVLRNVVATASPRLSKIRP